MVSTPALQITTAGQLKERLKALPVTQLSTTIVRKPVEEAGCRSSTLKGRRVIRDDDGNIVEVVKRRPGVTNSLLPAKKAKPGLDAARAAERPWTNA